MPSIESAVKKVSFYRIQTLLKAEICGSSGMGSFQIRSVYVDGELHVIDQPLLRLFEATGLQISLKFQNQIYQAHL